MEESYFLRGSARTVTLTLKIGIHTFRMTLLVMMMSNTPSFFKKDQSGSEDVVRTNISRGF